MATQLPKNEFISNSAAPPAVECEAVANAPAPLAATANLSVSDDENVSAMVGTYGVTGTEAVGSVRTAASDISDVGEIFRFAHQLCVEARQFVPDYPSIYQAMLDPNAPRALETDPVWADEVPLFLKA